MSSLNTLMNYLDEHKNELKENNYLDMCNILKEMNKEQENDLFKVTYIVPYQKSYDTISYKLNTEIFKIKHVLNRRCFIHINILENCEGIMYCQDYKDCIGQKIFLQRPIVLSFSKIDYNENENEDGNGEPYIDTINTEHDGFIIFNIEKL